MRKLMFSFTVVWLGITASALLAQEFSWEEIGRENHNLQVILVSPQDSKVIFAGSPGNILKSSDAGKSYRNVLAVRGGARNINALVMDRGNCNIIYAATDNGLYCSNNSGGRWELIFRGKNSLEKQCTTLLDNGNAIFVGTKAGLFVSWDNARSWQKESANIGNISILNIDSGPGQNPVIYLAGTSGIFKSLDKGASWERIFVSYSRENNSIDPVDEASETAEKISDIRYVKAGINNVNLVYFSCAKGVYKSLDQGANWEKLTEYGLLSQDVKMLCLSSDSQVYALTQSGVFLYASERWVEVSLGLGEGELKYLVLDKQDNIYVAGGKGIFKSIRQDFSTFKKQALLAEYLNNEPKIKDVQQAAIKYAEVSPEKIAQWRKKAAKKALLPQMSVGLDRNTTDLWHWEGGSTTKTDDDTLRRGKENIDWDVSLSWDFSDLIWNDAQTNIDVRSKLMVELRDDILDQVNKLYFERLRIRSELDNLAIENKSKRFDKQLKLEELAASLDSLTGGYYSEQLHKLLPKEQS